MFNSIVGNLFVKAMWLLLAPKEGKDAVVIEDPFAGFPETGAEYLQLGTCATFAPP